MPYIYKITNDIDEMIYIGKTSHDNPYDRFKEHIKDSRKERCKNRQLYKHMNEYGREHFHFNVIEEVENDEIACEREVYWISFYDTYRNGLNGTLGGDGKAYLCLNEEEVITYHTTVAEYVSGRTAKYFKNNKKTINSILDKNNIKHLTLKEFFNLKTIKEKVSERSRTKVKREKDGKEEIFNSIIEAVKDIETKSKDKTKVANVCTAIKKNRKAYGYFWEYI